MQLFVGLGNPGPRHQRQRHNIGFMAVDAIAERHGFGPWRRKYQGEVSEGRIAGEKILLLKPATFMNLSGQSVGEAARYLKVPLAEITVFHDELDLAPGKIRVKDGGGHAGHNGLRSIESHLGSEHRRVRLGIGHPGRKDLVSGYVLHDFAKADDAWLSPLIEGLAEAAPKLAAGDGPSFLNAVALRMQAANPKPKRQKREAAGSDGPRSPETEVEDDPPSLMQRLARHFGKG
ncbi:MAG: aminoacyl-tRNA hydrolase [Pseudomonadota bacterium]